jgi:hypothetical protein
MDAAEYGVRTVGMYIAFGERPEDATRLYVRQSVDGTVTVVGGDGHQLFARLIDGTDINIKIIESIVEALRARRKVA